MHTKIILPILTILFMILLIIVGPLLVIWALNTLFGLAIGYGIAEWFAAAILMGAIRAQTKWANR